MNKKLITLLIFSFILINQAIKLNATDNETYISSNNITYNEKENIIELSENSKINFNNINILIDKGIIDYDNGEFEVFGNFYLYEKFNILSGKNLKGDTALNSFKTENVSYIYNDDLKIDAYELYKDKDVLYFYNNFLTPCEIEGYFNCPTWSLRIDETRYDIQKDKFTHFDTFLQIADFKVFYLPYFTHYGIKAPRQRGFLTPTLEFNIGGDIGVITPYYLPLSQSADIVIKPNIYINDNFQILNNFQLNTKIKIRETYGNTELEIDNLKEKENSNFNNTFIFSTKRTLNKNRKFSAGGLFTNSISSTRSLNDESITFEDIYFNIENYNFLKKDDYLKVSIKSVASFESNSDNLIPLSSSINYENEIAFAKKKLENDIKFDILRRNSSNDSNPSESLNFYVNSEIAENKTINNFISYNKFKLMNSFHNYSFNHNSSLNNEVFNSSIVYSNDLFINRYQEFTPRLKFILPLSVRNEENTINEDSNSITFSYQNQFSENRFLGNDLFDNTPRLIFGIESKINLFRGKFNFNLNRSYDFNKVNNYAEEINQNTNFSDYALELNSKYNDLLFSIDTRLDQKNLSKKEMNYSLYIDKPFKLKLNYNETQARAFKSSSNETQSLDFIISNKLNNHFELGYTTSLDLKNNFNPYKSSVNLSLFDECSQLDITYSNTRFNDNFKTQPEEKINLSFKMDYLGFFGYEQTTDLFFNEPGDFNYGL